MLERYAEYTAEVLVRENGQMTLPKFLREKLKIGTYEKKRILIIALPIKTEVSLPEASSQ